MAELGDIFRNVEITEIAFGGDGVARLSDGAVVFVPFTAVGDVIELEVTEAHKNFNRGKVVKFIKEVNHVDEACPYYGRCGGCAYQHISYEAEIEAKRGQFVSTMQRIGHFSEFPQLEKFVPSPKRYGYRNKLRLEPCVPHKAKYGTRRKTTMAAAGRTGKLNYGFCEHDNETFFPVSYCPIAMDCINDAIPGALKSDWAAQNAKREEPYPLTFRADASGKATFFFGRASSKLPWLHENLLDVDTSVPVGSFWQVNPPVAAEILKTMRGWLEPLKTRAFVDAYAGVGTFSLALGDMFQYRVVIENDEQAVNASRFNHKNRGIKGNFIADSTENALDKVLAKVNNSETVVLLDPPRTGCLPKVVSILREFKPAFIAYVSCNPTTLARDLRMLCEEELYKPVHAAAFDMFPATAHFESAVFLVRNK